MRLALFDVDGTVLRGNSWHEYFWWTARCRPGLAPGLLARLVLRRAGLLSARTLQHAALRPLRGLNAAAVQQHGRRLGAERLHGMVRPAARREMAQRRAEGCTLVLATGAFDFLAEPLAAELGVEEVVCTRLEFVGGLCTGRIAGAEARGQTKADLVRARFAARAVDWAQSRAYSDDWEDAPLFALVGQPVFIAPGWTRPAGAPSTLQSADWDASA
jgi:putative phosphoserine phosphatase/1-acylglycerol-3-phosphate O-acyltransferase